MKKNSKLVKGCAVVMAAVMALSAGILSRTYAAIAVETDKDCSLTVEVDPSDTLYDDLKDLSIPISLYKVADITKEGNYVALTDFDGLGLDKVSSDTTAGEWETMGLGAFDIVKVGTTLPDFVFTMKDAKGSTKDDGNTVKPGMYLVVAGAYDDSDKDHLYGTVMNPEAVYEFKPYLISLPTNNYASVTSIGSPVGSDDWIYDVKTGLKPSKTDRLGHLRIIKQLDTFNKTMNDPDGATFVFSVVAVKNGKTVYDDVVAIQMKKAGIDFTEILNLPAGAVVTVTEVYSGSCYTLVSSATDSATIVADAFVEVDFENDWNETTGGGYGVVNHFKYSQDKEGRDVWEWEKLEGGNNDEVLPQ